ncbi:FHA domain-containing protein [Agromyces intestinalis]|uniref:FHA domain-containing protein n=1 Tax=Agromyces intestinalis TaxID=2592652 RepID=A0A5C1YI96_9MICO|nr:FHA domain-containing protein [Agromyces intestinalis]QEO15693.1 FHA domain-containing protein [Agromyces intestinalis]
MIGYHPSGGEWLAVVRGDSVLVVPRGDDATVVGLWAALGEPDAFGAALARLARNGLAAMMPFALVAGGGPGGSRRVAVRGGCEVVADGQVIRASVASGWLERTIEAAAAWQVRVDGETGDSGSVWPIREAVVLAAGVRSIDDADAAAEPASPPQHTLIPEPEPEPEPEEVVDAAEDSTVVIDRSALRRPDTAPRSAASVLPAAAPVQPAPAPPAPSAVEPTSFGGEHDGATIVVSPAELRREASGRLTSDASATPPPPEPAPAAAPAVRLRLPGGALEPLAGDVVIGRSPSVNRAAGTRLPRLLTLGAGDPDISRSHVRVGLEGGTVVVTDLHSRNGTNVLQPGRPPVKLRPGEPTPVLIGTVVDLGGGWSFAVEAG